MKQLLIIISLLAGLNLLAQTNTPAEADSATAPAAPAANSSAGESSGAPANAEDSFNYPAPADKQETQGNFSTPGSKRCLVCEAMQRKQKQLASDAHSSSRLSARGRQAVVAGENTTAPVNNSNSTDDGTDSNVGK